MGLIHNWLNWFSPRLKHKIDKYVTYVSGCTHFCSARWHFHNAVTFYTHFYNLPTSWGAFANLFRTPLREELVSSKLHAQMTSRCSERSVSNVVNVVLFTRPSTVIRTGQNVRKLLRIRGVLVLLKIWVNSQKLGVQALQNVKFE